MKDLNTCISRAFALAAFVMGALTCHGADATPSSERPPVNYVVRVDWISPKSGTNFLQLIATEGTFKLNGSQPSAVRIGDSELPVSVNIDGNLKALNSEQGQLQLFLGRSVPFVTHSGGPPGSASVQQRQDGLTSTLVVTFGKPLLIQKDGNGEVSISVERVTP